MSFLLFVVGLLLLFTGSIVACFSLMCWKQTYVFCQDPCPKRTPGSCYHSAVRHIWSHASIMALSLWEAGNTLIYLVLFNWVSFYVLLLLGVLHKLRNVSFTQAYFHLPRLKRGLKVTTGLYGLYDWYQVQAFYTSVCTWTETFLHWMSTRSVPFISAHLGSLILQSHLIHSM